MTSQSAPAFRSLGPEVQLWDCPGSLLSTRANGTQIDAYQKPRTVADLGSGEGRRKKENVKSQTNKSSQADIVYASALLQDRAGLVVPNVW